MASSGDLHRAQTLLSELIRATEGVERTLAQDAPEVVALRDALASTVRSDPKLDAVHRLEVYANAYFYRILDCLKEDFPALLALVGDTGFHDLITAYLEACPSSHFSMREVGRALPGFVARAGATRWVRERWPFAADLATFEWSFLDVFDAPNGPVASRADLASVPPERFADLCFEVAVCVQCLSLDPRAVRVQQQAQAGESLDPGAPSATPQDVLVWRRNERVSSRNLSPDEASALRGVRQGRSFGELCVDAAERVGEEVAPASVAGWLGSWIEAGCVARCCLDGDPTLPAH